VIARPDLRNSAPGNNPPSPPQLHPIEKNPFPENPEKPKYPIEMAGDRSGFFRNQSLKVLLLCFPAPTERR
jgi:hypothetical protein